MRKQVIAVALVTALLAIPVAARSFTLPFIPWIPDTCFFGGICVQFTEVTALAQLQSVLTELENLKNLHGAGIIGAIEGQAMTIYARMHAAPPEHIADTAATTEDTQQPDVAAHIAAANAAAQTSTGAHADVQASNLYLSTIATQGQTANEMHAADVEQAKTVNEDLAAMMIAQAGEAALP